MARTVVAAAILIAAFIASAQARADTYRAALEAIGDRPAVILLRHTQTTPGVGDPDGYTLADCATQRNLNDIGEAQAAAIGAAMVEAGVRIGKILSSRWCRAIDTADLVKAAAGQQTVETEIFPALDNAWDDRSRIDEQVADIRAAALAWRGPGALLMSSHGVTLGPVMGQRLPQGGFLVVTPDAGALRLIAAGGP